MCVWSYFNYTILIKQQKTYDIFIFIWYTASVFQYFLLVYPNDMDAPFDSRFVCWISQVTRINRMSAGKLPPQHLQVGHGWETHPRYGQLHIDTRVSQEDWHVCFFCDSFLETLVISWKPRLLSDPVPSQNQTQKQILLENKFRVLVVFSICRVWACSTYFVPPNR